MPNRSHRRSQRPSQAPVARPAFSEPEVHRWPHPIPQPCTPAPTESSLHYIRCALSYQNELLCEIKTLLERLTVESADES